MRATGMWFLLLAAMMANGLVRVLVLQPALGEHLARQLASLTGVAIIFTLAGLFVRGNRAVPAPRWMAVGLLWLTLTLSFEFLFGHYVGGQSWASLLADYDLTRGRLWPLVAASTLAAPPFWARVLRPGASPPSGR